MVCCVFDPSRSNGGAYAGGSNNRDGKNPDRRVAAPQIGIINRTAALLSRLSSELGFSPTARSRVVASPHGLSNASDDPLSQSLDDFLLEGERMRAELQKELSKKN
jgi:hypothetical protein